MALDNVLKIYDEQGNPVDYDILASDVKFNDGKDLPTKLDELEEEIGEGGYTPPQGGIPKTDLATAVQESLNLADSSLQPSDKTQLQGAITQLQNALNTLIGSGNVQGAIDTFNEVVAFLSGISSSDTLAAKLAQLATDISGKVDKVTGYGLSKNDYTDTDKAKVASAIQGVIVGSTEVTPDSNKKVTIPAGVDGITPHIGANDNWWVGPETDPNNDTGIKAQGPAGPQGAQGNSGVASADEVIVVNNVTEGGTTVEEGGVTKVKVLSAEMGKELNDKMYRKPVTSTSSTTYDAGDLDGTFINGARTPGAGITNVAGSTRANLSKAGTGYYLATDFPDTFVVHVPSGYNVNVNQVKITTPTQDSSNWLMPGWLDDGDSVTLDKATYPYVTINARKTDDATITNAILETLTNGFSIEEIETTVEQATLQFVDENGNVENEMYNSQDATTTEVYTKEAVDNLLSGALLPSNHYRTGEGGELPTTAQVAYETSDFAYQKQRQPGQGLDGGSADRICIDRIFDLENDDLQGVFSMYVPSGYMGSMTQCKVTTATSNASNYIINDMATEEIEISPDPAYRYVTFNFRRTDNHSTTSADVTALAAGFYMEKVAAPTINNTKAIEVIGENGEVVKSIFNTDDGQKVQIPTKSYVDNFVGAEIKPTVRVLAWNIGHFAVGSDWRTKITDADYDAKLMAWKKLLNQSAASILLLSEYNADFGSHTVNGETVAENAFSVLFSSYFGYNSIGSQSAYSFNAIMAKYAFGGGSNVDYTNRGQGMYYRLDTITIGGKTVKLVATHLDWSQNETYAGYRAAQIQQLITAFKNEPYVIIGGDFNVDSASEFEPFVANGFTILNHGSLGDICTYPATGANAINTNINNKYGASPEIVLDNIIVKGFRISDVRVVDEGTLSDHCGLVADLTMI